MSCCGGGGRSTGPALPGTGVVTTRSYVRPAFSLFRYEGENPIVIIGRITGTRYRFAGRGSEVAIDIRDRPSMRQVPHLREVRPA